MEFLLNNLQDLLVYHAHLIGDAKRHIEDLERDLRVFRAFLRDSVKKRRKDEGIQMLVRNIRDVVYDVEDTIDTFVTQAAEIKTQNYFIRAWKGPVNLHTIGKKVEAVRMKVEQARVDFAVLSVADEDKYEKPEVNCFSIFIYLSIFTICFIKIFSLSF